MAVPGPFTASPATRAGPNDAHRQATFSRFKALCVPLLEAARAPTSPQSTRTLVDLLTNLADLLRTTPRHALSPALANYAFFPLSSLLRPPLDARDRGDRVLEATMHALAALATKWRAAGMDPRVRQQLWTMTALALGGPLDPRGPGKAKGKGKAVDRTDEAQLAMVEVLLALMRPDQGGEAAKEDEDEDDPLGERIDWSRVDPSDPSSFDAPPQPPHDPPPPIPVLFHTLTTLLDLAAEPTSLLKLQLSSLEALRILVVEYLAHPSPSATVPVGAPGPSPLLATALPGTASTLSRIALSMPSSSQAEYGKSTRRQASPVVIAALETLAQLVVETVGDEVTASLRAGAQGEDKVGARAATLEELVDTKFGEMALHEDEPEGVSDDAPEPPDEPPVAAPPPSGPVIPTRSWLRFTLTSLTTLSSALSPLSTHDSAPVRAALVSLLSDVLSRCARTLGPHAEVLLEGLLALASDEWDPVRDPARRALLAAFSAQPLADDPDSDSDSDSDALALVVRIVQRRLAALPGALRRQDEHAVRRGAGIIRSALDLLPNVASPSPSSSSTPRRPLPSPLHSIDKWSWALLSALELERVPRAGRPPEGGMALAWITASGDAPSARAPGATGAGAGAGAGASAYPPVRLRGTAEAATVRALEALWAAVGRAAARAGQGGEVVEQFLGVALGPRRDENAAVSALWVLEGVMSGLGGGMGAGLAREQRQVFKRATRAVLALLEDLEAASREEDEPAQVRPDVEEQRRDVLAVEEEDDERSTPIRLVELKKGVTAMPSLDAYKPVAALSTTRDQRASHLLLLSSFSLRLLATAANALSSSFRPFLMQVMYHVLAHLSPTAHPFVRAHAQHALALIADATAYASPQTLVLANVDYVVNSVSQRLSVARLEPSAPLVLVEMIRLVGQPIVPMVQDLVDDVFEALDDYHGYEELTVGLWAVLDALLKVMVEDLPPRSGPAVGDSAATRGVPRPDVAEDWRELEEWVAHRHDPPVATTADTESATDNLPEENPRQPFASMRDAAPEPEADADNPSGDPTFASDAVAPPTRPQRVTAQILHKALFFLSHPSAFLRARVLSLFASSVPLLTLPALSATGDPTATREADLLPVVHRAWPLVLLRLAPPPREEAHVALEAVRLVQALAEHTGEYMSRRIAEDVWPRFAALLSAPGPGPGGAAAAPALGRFSARHRLDAALLDATRSIARHVPMKEPQVWDAALVLRRFVVPPSGTGTRPLPGPGPGPVEPELRALAQGAYEALGRQNADAVWCVLRGTVGGEGAEGLPRWLGRGWEGAESSEAVEEVLAGL